MKIIKKIIAKVKCSRKKKTCDDSLRVFFRSEYKKDSDSAYWYWKTTNGFDYYR